ncbi:uncharacterized protein LOC144425597 [Styela clava]
MKISIVFILIYVIAPCWCQDETVFHCSPKPGCQIAHCDSDRLTFDIDKHTKEYPISCKSNSTVLSWLDLASRNLDITNIRNDLKKLENKFDKKMESFGKEISDLAEMQEMNEMLVEDNKKMKKAISRIEEKLAFMEKTRKLSNRSGQITRPTTKTRTTLNPTPPPENCEFKIRNICYFGVIPGRYVVNYDKAVDICKKRNADVGLIRDEESYNAIVNYLRSNILKKNLPSPIIIWTGSLFDPMTRDVTPADSFTKWLSRSPLTGIDNKDRTNIYLLADSSPTYHGMGNGNPTWKYQGVICEIVI